MRRILLLAALLLVVPAGAARAELPPIKHVMVVLLENENYDRSFGVGQNAPTYPYLAREVNTKGALLSNYFAIGHLSLDNYIAMISGQAPNPVTQSDCVNFTEFASLGKGPDGQYLGSGCVYPREVQTIANQMDAKNLSWKGYMEDMAAAPAGQSKTCRHPPVGQQDPTQSAKKGDQYAARHNPFVYFRSIIDDTVKCNANVVDFSQIGADLANASSTPNFGFITPNLCNDGHDEPCVDGRPGGGKTADEWLRTHVPAILDSPGMRDDGLLVLTFDEAEAAGMGGDSTACCAGQNPLTTPDPGATTPGPGGGKIGAVLLSPFIKPGTVSAKKYNHYDFLRTVEDIYGLDHLGYAGSPLANTFGTDVFNQTPELSMTVKASRKLRKRRRTSIVVTVDHPAEVTFTGACRIAGTRSTDKDGRVALRFKRGLRRAGKCVITARREGYASAEKTLKVRK